MKKTLAFVALAVALLFAGPSAQTSIGNFTRLIVDGRNAANISVAAVTLTDAQIKALPTTPITIAAAPGAGYRLNVVTSTFLLDSIAGAYTNIDTTYAAVAVVHATAGDLWLQQGPVNDNSYTTPLADLTAWLGAAHSSVYTTITPMAAIQNVASGDRLWVVGPTPPPKSDVENLPAKVSIYNGVSGNLTGGNAANTLKVTVYYVKEAL